VDVCYQIAIFRGLEDELIEDVFLRTVESGPVYQPIPHELFTDKNRVEYLKKRNKKACRSDADRNQLINLTGKSVLDIGCNIGYFGWKNVNKLKWYTGIDSDPVCIKIAQIIKEELGYENLQFTNIDLIDFIEKTKSHYDICLFFSIYHHMLYQIGIGEARKALNNVSLICDELYFDMGQKDEPTNRYRHKWHNLLPIEQPKLYIQREIIINTVFKSAEFLGETKVGNSKRLLFRFTK